MARAKRSRVQCKCKQCETVFIVNGSLIKRGEGKFCCRQCYLEWHAAPPATERFLAKIGPKDSNGCMLWLGNTLANGYGKFSPEIGKSVFVHRYAWEMKHGPIPNGMCVLHKCDIRRCVNVEHLFLGTLADNSADMVMKRRSVFGERNPNAKLTEQQVIMILALRKRFNYSQKRLAMMFDVTKAAIFKILRGENWKHLSRDQEAIARIEEALK